MRHHSSGGEAPQAPCRSGRDRVVLRIVALTVTTLDKCAPRYPQGTSYVLDACFGNRGRDALFGELLAECKLRARAAVCAACADVMTLLSLARVPALDHESTRGIGQGCPPRMRVTLCAARMCLLSARGHVDRASGSVRSVSNNPQLCLCGVICASAMDPPLHGVRPPCECVTQVCVAVACDIARAPSSGVRRKPS